MDDPQGQPPENHPNPPPTHAYSQDFRHSPVAARVPEKVTRGVFTTATMILQTSNEFVIDFVSAMNQPQQIVARVILTPGTFSQFVGALRINIGKFEQDFGPLPPPPAGIVHPPMPITPPPASGISDAHVLPPAPLESMSVQAGPGVPQSPPPPRPSIEELYEQWKLPDDLMGGSFANAVMIRHTPYEFCFDFIANFYPKSVVTARVYVSAGRVLSLLDAMSNSWQKFQQMLRSGPPPGAPPSPPAPQ